MLDEIRTLLEKPLSLPLEVNQGYECTHDDNDGDPIQLLSVVQSQDGDMWIKTWHLSMLRYRMPLIGGGLYPAVHNALKILAYAIQMDNEAKSNGRQQYLF